jgi:hypothetical protein
MVGCFCILGAGHTDATRPYSPAPGYVNRPSSRDRQTGQRDSPTLYLGLWFIVLGLWLIVQKSNKGNPYAIISNPDAPETVNTKK